MATYPSKTLKKKFLILSKNPSLGSPGIFNFLSSPLSSGFSSNSFSCLSNFSFSVSILFLSVSFSLKRVVFLTRSLTLITRLRITIKSLLGIIVGFALVFFSGSVAVEPGRNFVRFIFAII